MTHYQGGTPKPQPQHKDPSNLRGEGEKKKKKNYIPTTYRQMDN